MSFFVSPRQIFALFSSKQGLLAALSLAAGLIFPLALAPYHYWIIAPLSIGLLYLLAQQAYNSKQAFFIGWLYGIGLWFTGAFWLYTSIHTYGNTPAPIAVFLVFLLAMMMGLFNAFQLSLFYKLNQYFKNFKTNVFGFGFLWMLFDWIKTWLFTGFPWLFAGYALTGTDFGHYAALGGVYLVTGLLVVISASVIEAFTLVILYQTKKINQNHRQQSIFPLKSPIVLATIFGLFFVVLSPLIQQHQWTRALKSPPLSTSLIQGNIPQNLKWLTEYRQKTLDIYEALSQSEWRRNLVVWPEASIPMLQSDAAEFVTHIKNTAKENHSSWVTGIPWEDFNEPADASGYHPFYNTIMATGYNASGLYKKQRLVPVGEYTPLRGAINWMLPELAKNGHDFNAGQSHQSPLQVWNYQLGAAICYEVAYPQITRKNALNTNFMITISNDAWFDGSDGPAQHLQMVQMRAIETGRWFIRATNTGITAFIDNKGQIQKTAPQQTVSVLRGQLPPYSGNTPYMKWGEWPTFILMAFLTLIYQHKLNRMQRKIKEKPSNP